jgi:putative flippase GtrA
MIAREIFRFTLVGTSTVVVAYIIYLSLTSLGLDIDIANGLAYTCGVFISFFANKSWTFNSSHNSLTVLRFLALHVASLFSCVLINALAYDLFAGIAYQFEIAFLLGIMTSTVINFSGMKFFVFAPSEKMLLLRKSK